MKYKITMNKRYNEIEFIYDSLSDAYGLILSAFKHSNGDISFTIEVITEEEGENADEE